MVGEVFAGMEIDGELPTDQSGGRRRDCLPASLPFRTASAQRREQRLERYRRCRELHQQGLTNRQIGWAIGLHEATVQKFVQSESFPERAVPVRSRMTDRHAEYLKQRWEQGCHNARVLYEELCQLGFTGSFESVCRSVAQWRIAPRIRRAAIAKEQATITPRLSADQVSWLIVQPLKDRSKGGEQLVHAIAGLNASWAKGIELARQFPDAMRVQNVAEFDAWLEEAFDKDSPPEIRRFANGLRRDLDAVRRAFNSPWSNGQTEGHVNRLKLIKRQMYGRASFDLLRIRFLNAA